MGCPQEAGFRGIGWPAKWGQWGISADSQASAKQKCTHGAWRVYCILIFMTSSQLSTASSPSLQMQGKMMAYDRVVVELNAARLRGTSFPVIHAFIQAALSLNPDVRAFMVSASLFYSSIISQRTHQVIQLFHILAKIAGELPGTPPLAHAGAHILNTPLMERRHARAYFGDPESREAIELRKQIASGARAALEEQYLDVLERTLQARPLEARLGGDPTIANRVRAFLLVRYYRGGEWQDRIEVCSVLVFLKPSSTSHAVGCSSTLMG